MRRRDFWIFLISAVLVGGLLAAPSWSQTAPKFVATYSGAGFVKCYPTASADSTGARGLGLLQVTAATETTLSLWNYSTAWSKTHPLFGNAAPDTVITIPAGGTHVYISEAGRFGGGIWAVYVSAGSGKMAGE